MIDLKRIAAGTAIAGSLGLAAVGLGAGVASAAPPNSVSGSGWALNPGWGHGGGGHGGPGWNNDGWNGGGGPNWGPPPPPNYGYGGYNNYGGPGGCFTGPFGLLHYCN